MSARTRDTSAGPRIVCAGMCDTKGPEIRFLASQVAQQGGRPSIMDLSLGSAVDWADIPLMETLRTTGTRIEAVQAATRGEAAELVGAAAAAKARELHAAGLLDGVISWAGSVGTATATRMMRALPFGVPKVMLTDMASGDVSAWLGSKDIYIASPTAEQGINVVTRKAIANAAAAIVGMATVPAVRPGTRPLCAITGYGSTTPLVGRCRAWVEARDWEAAVFHAVGPGAAMEDLIRDGLISAVFDVTPGELVNALVGGVYGTPRGWDGVRMTAAAQTGIPQVVAPGGLDQCALGPLETVPAALLEDVRTGVRRSPGGSGRPYRHNDGVTLLSPTLDEIEAVAEHIAAALSPTTGPTAFFLPMRGWSAYDQPAAVATRQRGWPAGRGDGPTWEPDPDRPEWSRRSTRMLRILAERLDRSNDRLDLVAADMHLLDPGFAELVTRCMGDMLDGTWRPGLYRDVPGVLSGAAIPVS